MILCLNVFSNVLAKARMKCPVTLLMRAQALGGYHIKVVKSYGFKTTLLQYSVSKSVLRCHKTCQSD